MKTTTTQLKKSLEGLYVEGSRDKYDNKFMLELIHRTSAEINALA